MSESTFPFKKAIPTIVVTWILSLVTILALVYFVPNIFPKTWHEVERFEGYNTDNYWETFDVPSMHWRIVWVVSQTTSTSLEDARFQLIVDGFTLRELTGWGTYGYLGKDYFTGSGVHRTEVYAESVAWFLTVEAYY